MNMRTQFRVELLPLLLGFGGASDDVVVLIELGPESGNYIAPIADGSGEFIGEILQNHLLDPVTKERVGTGRGYGFNIDPSHSFINGTGNDTTPYLISHRMFHLGGDTLNFLNEAILSGTGRLAKYAGGSVVNDVLSNDGDETLVEVRSIEPEEKSDGVGGVDANGDGGTGSQVNLRIEARGGYRQAITDDRGNAVGELFSRTILDPDGNAVGEDLGYAYHFPNETAVENNGVRPDDALIRTGLRRFAFDDGSSADLVDDAVAHGTGSLGKYAGSILGEEIVSADPFVSEVVLAVPAGGKANPGPPEASAGRDVDPYDFLVATGGDGFRSPIRSAEGQIGVTFQHPVLDPAGEQIGTTQGYAFTFPPSDHAAGAHQGSDHFYLEGGELIALGEFIVAGTGAYANYAGGYLKQTMSNSGPPAREITLVSPHLDPGEVAMGSAAPPEGETVTSGVDTDEEVSSSIGNDEEVATGCFVRTIVTWKLNLAFLLGIMLVAAS